MGYSTTIDWRPKRVHVFLQFKMRIKLRIFISPFLRSPLAPISKAIVLTPALRIPLGLLETRFSFWSKSEKPAR